jgi:hypothetical protein
MHNKMDPFISSSCYLGYDFSTFILIALLEYEKIGRCEIVELYGYSSYLNFRRYIIELSNCMRCFFTQAKQFDLYTLALFGLYEQKKFIWLSPLYRIC